MVKFQSETSFSRRVPLGLGFWWDTVGLLEGDSVGGLSTVMTPEHESII